MKESCGEQANEQVRERERERGSLRSLDNSTTQFAGPSTNVVMGWAKLTITDRIRSAWALSLFSLRNNLTSTIVDNIITKFVLAGGVKVGIEAKNETLAVCFEGIAPGGTVCACVGMGAICTISFGGKPVGLWVAGVREDGGGGIA